MIAAVYILGTGSVLVSIAPEQTNALYGLMEAISSDAARLNLSADHGFSRGCQFGIGAWHEL